MNEAEFIALIFGLEQALLWGVTHLDAFGDSMIVVRAVNGTLRCRVPRLLVLAARARALVQRFARFDITHVGREFNREADRLTR